MIRLHSALVCLLGISLLASCNDGFRDEFTVEDLMRANDVNDFMIRLPKDLKPTDSVGLELFNKNGVVDSSFVYTNLEPSELIKVFITKEVEDYRYSIVRAKSAISSVYLDEKGATLRMWEGNSFSEIIPTGEAFAVFSADGTSSLPHPSGDDIALRVAVKLP